MKPAIILKWAVAKSHSGPPFRTAPTYTAAGRVFFATGDRPPAFIFSSPIKEGILFSFTSFPILANQKCNANATKKTFVAFATSFNNYSPGTKETGTLTIIVIYVMLHIEKGVARKRSAPLFNEVIA
ncbi:hypothetical protein ACT26D_00830 [Megasphaera elsdenii]|uniref:hypothetical protein n=1 Tax=Megasphaera elsdenii TaxID=907 RepID=UPI002586DB79|nr:hypothetical protein [uncultured Megasphaera sp.]